MRDTSFVSVLMPCIDRQLLKDRNDPAFRLAKLQFDDFGFGDENPTAELESIIQEAAKRKESAVAQEARKLLDRFRNSPRPVIPTMFGDDDEDYDSLDDEALDKDFESPHALFADGDGADSPQEGALADFIESVISGLPKPRQELYATLSACWRAHLLTSLPSCSRVRHRG